MPVSKREAERIVVTWVQSRDRFNRLARELHRLLDEDQTFPREAVYTVRHRLKGEQRLLEKIDQRNSSRRKRSSLVDHSNFLHRIDDLLGLRVICLRLSDLKKVRAYIDSLRDEERIRLLRGPIEMKTFLVRPGENEPSAPGRLRADLQYSGYSSIHYVVKLGRASNPARDLAQLTAELQLRTVFEEAWGEIDHKYRYELTRSGARIPQYIEDGFRDLGLYLQAVARQAEHLCEQSELISPPRKHRRARKRLQPRAAQEKPARVPSQPKMAPPATLAEVLQRAVGFQPTERTLAYIQRRLDETEYHQARSFGFPDLDALLTPELLARYREIYQQVLQHDPFLNPDLRERDMDVVPLVNFAIFSSVQSQTAAEAGLQATLRARPRW